MRPPKFIYIHICVSIPFQFLGPGQFKVGPRILFYKTIFSQGLLGLLNNGMIQHNYLHDHINNYNNNNIISITLNIITHKI